MLAVQWAPQNSASLTCGDVSMLCRGHRCLMHMNRQVNNNSQIQNLADSLVLTVKLPTVHLIQVTSILSANSNIDFKEHCIIIVSNYSCNYIVCKHCVEGSVKVSISALYSFCVTSHMGHITLQHTEDSLLLFTQCTLI